MKWYVPPAVVICGINCMSAAIILCLAAFHLFTDKSTNAPTAPNEEWISLVSGVVLFSVFWLIVSIVGMWLTMTKRQFWLSSLVLALYIVGFGIALYYTIAFCNQLGMEDAKAEILFNTTFYEIWDANNKHQTKTWIPEWLDNIQKQSKHCCGIITYRDYEEFWPESPTVIPRSCCRAVKNVSAACPEDITRIPFPHTTADYVKVESGCMDTINQATRNHIEESYHNCVLMTVFIGFATIAFLIVYVKRYLAAALESDIKGSLGGDDGGGGGDSGALTGANEQDQTARVPPLTIASSGLIAGSIDSVEGVLPVTSTDTVLSTFPTLPVAQPAPREPKQTASAIRLVGPISDAIRLNDKDRGPRLVLTGVDASESTLRLEKPNYQMFRSTVRGMPSVTKLKVNAVFAGIKNQNKNLNGGSEASTGDDMTIGAGNLGRQEVFIAQDTMDPRTESDRRTLHSSNSFDDVGDIVPDADAVSSSPPGSPGKRRRERKLAVSRHRHHHL